MNAIKPFAALPERGIIIEASRRNRLLFLGTWALMTPGFITLVWRLRNFQNARDCAISVAILTLFWLLISASIANQITMKIELNATTIAVSSVFRRRRQLSIGEIKEARILDLKGRRGLRFVPIDSAQNSVPIVTDILGASDAKLISAFVSKTKLCDMFGNAVDLSAFPQF